VRESEKSVGKMYGGKSGPVTSLPVAPPHSYLKFIVYGYSGVDLMLFVVVIVLQEQIHGLCFP
jgi:hypothetical protein